jgi:hypothetical protein
MLPIGKRVTIRPARVCGFKAIRIPKTCGVQGRIDTRRPSRLEEKPQNEGKRRQQRQKIAGRPHARKLPYNSGKLTRLNLNCRGCVDVALCREMPPPPRSRDAGLVVIDGMDESVRSVSQESIKIDLQTNQLFLLIFIIILQISSFFFLRLATESPDSPQYSPVVSPNPQKLLTTYAPFHLSPTMSVLVIRGSLACRHAPLSPATRAQRLPQPYGMSDGIWQ